jgi:N-methylhydantoinase A
MLRLGVDIGGTFTDLAAVDAEGIVAVGKVLTSSERPARAVEEVVEATLSSAGLAAADVERVVHGTTLVTNAIIERTGALTALLATEGFRDVIEIGRERRYELYDLMIELPRPLVPRHLRFDVAERTLADGTVERGIDVVQVERLARELVEHGIDAVAIAFLHGYANPANEQAARDAVLRAAPGLRVALSSEVVPELREYERTSTTIASVYVQDRVERYLVELDRRLDRLGVPGPLYVMLSNGGIATLDTAKRFPIRLLESGPAAGALAAAALGVAGGHPDLLSFDMGGTTAKLCLIEDGRPLVTHESEVDRVYRLRPGSGLPVKTPVIDMIEIGVGGGSIARLDALGLLRVGPESAGSSPGPACYGLGGTEPTVTDADLVLGYLDPGYFLGGRMELDLDAARRAIAERIAEPLGVTVEEAAWGIHRGVNDDMANAARVHAVERGRDPAGLPLFAFGGAGPVHGAGVARALGSSIVIAPAAAGVMSSAGFLTAPLSFDFVRSGRRVVRELAWTEVEGLYGAMEAEGTALLAASGLSEPEIAHERLADLRYVGQGFEIRVAAPSTGEDWPESLLTAFARTYRRLYGRDGPPVDVEALSWRVVSSGPRPTLRLRPHLEASSPDAAKGSRLAYFGEPVETRVLDRYALAPGASVRGPAIVEERESTLVLPPGAACTVADDLSLVVDASDLVAQSHKVP